MVNQSTMDRPQINCAFPLYDTKEKMLVFIEKMEKGNLRYRNHKGLTGNPLESRVDVTLYGFDSAPFKVMDTSMGEAVLYLMECWEEIFGEE